MEKINASHAPKPGIKGGFSRTSPGMDSFPRRQPCSASDAIEPVRSADKEVALGNCDGGAQVCIRVAAHRDGAEQFEFVGRGHYENVTPGIEQINFTVRPGGRRFQFGEAGQFALGLTWLKARPAPAG